MKRFIYTIIESRMCTSCQCTSLLWIDFSA